MADNNAIIKGSEPVQRYYNLAESRIGYALLLGSRRHFGYYDSRDSWPIPIGRALRRMEDKIYEALDVQCGLVLDAGCGNGKVAIRMAKKGLKVEGIDIVQRHVRRARKRVARRQLESQVNCALGDYHDLSRFKDGTFDGMYTMETFVHASDPERALAEFFRVLKPGGRIAQLEYDHSSPLEMSEQDRQSLQLVNKHAAMPANQMFERGSLEKMLRKAGFIDVQVVDWSEHVEPMMRLFYYLAYYPYLLIVYLGLQAWFINAVAAVEMYRAGKAGVVRIIRVTARKPEHGGDSGAVGTVRQRKGQ